MRVKACLFIAAVMLAAIIPPDTNGFESPQEKHSRSEKDLSAIGRRNLGGDRGLGNWFSIAHEQEIGRQFDAEIEKPSKVLNDPVLNGYVTRIAGNIAKNSDAKFPITVRLLDTEEAEAFALPGGYQYITRGLLLRLDSEGELASVLARGIAHTALRSATRLMTRESWAKLGTAPPIFVGQSGLSKATLGFDTPLMTLSFRRQYEMDADYFGAQYLYKSGYSAESLVNLIERIWPPDQQPAKPFSPFPPTPDRVKVLRKEIEELLPKRDSEISTTPEFESFKERLLSLEPKPMPAPVPTSPTPSHSPPESPAKSRAPN